MQEVERFYLNPFSLITETETEFVINNSIDYNARFAKKSAPVLSVLMSGRGLALSEITRLIAPTRLKELEEKRIILRDKTPPTVGRYSRQLGFLSLITPDYQGLHHQLTSSHVLVLGAGAIGSHVMWNLAAMGVGNLTVVDFDCVEESNLNRQLMYTPADIGALKVEVLARKISEFNPTIRVTGLNRKITSVEDIASLLEGVDFVVRAIDTPEAAGSWLNAACVPAGVPYVQGGFIDRMAVVGPNYDPGSEGCLACINPGGSFRRIHGTGPTFAPLAALVSSLIAVIVFKSISGKVEEVRNRVFTFDLETYSWITHELRPVRDCPVCGAKAAAPVPPIDPARTGLWVQRISYAALLLVIVAIRNGLDQVMVGLIGLLLTFMTIPWLRSLLKRDEPRIRRELFVTSCLYVTVSIAGALLGEAARHGVAFPRTFEAWTDAVQATCLLFLEVAAGLTILFFLMTSVERNVFARLEPAT